MEVKCHIAFGSSFCLQMGPALMPFDAPIELSFSTSLAIFDILMFEVAHFHGCEDRGEYCKYCIDIIKA